MNTRGAHCWFGLSKFSAIQRSLGFPNVLCQDKKQKFVFTKRSYKTVRAENSELSAADPVGCVFLGLPFSSCEISGEEYLNPVCRLI